MTHLKEFTVERLVIGDPSGRGRIEPTGSHIAFYGRRKIARALLGLRPTWDDAPQLEFYDLSGQRRLAISLEESGPPIITLKDGNGRDRIILQMFDDGSAGIAPCDAIGADRMNLSVDVKEGTPCMSLSDRRTKLPVLIEADEDRLTPALSIYDGQGNRAWHTPTGKEG